MSKVYVGNLSWATTDSTLESAFSEYGTVNKAAVERDRDTSRSRGFGFVTMSSPEEANAAIEALHEQELDGRRIKVNSADSRAGGGGGGGRGGFGGGGPNSYGGGGGGYSGGGGQNGY